MLINLFRFTAINFYHTLLSAVILLIIEILQNNANSGTFWICVLRCYWDFELDFDLAYRWALVISGCLWEYPLVYIIGTDHIMVTYISYYYKLVYIIISYNNIHQWTRHCPVYILNQKITDFSFMKEKKPFGVDRIMIELWRFSNPFE